VEPRTFQNGL